MESIYLAVAEYYHEGFDVIRAFRVRSDAEKFIVPFIAHNEARPTFSLFEHDFHSPEWVAYTEKLRAWEALAPEGYETWDGFRVIETTLY